MFRKRVRRLRRREILELGKLIDRYGLVANTGSEIKPNIEFGIPNDLRPGDSYRIRHLLSKAMRVSEASVVFRLGSVLVYGPTDDIESLRQAWLDTLRMIYKAKYQTPHRYRR